MSEAARTGGSAAQNEVALWCALKINEEMPAAHDALGDVRATAKCFFDLKAKGIITQEN